MDECTKHTREEITWADDTKEREIEEGAVYAY